MAIYLISNGATRTPAVEEVNDLSLALNRAARDTSLLVFEGRFYPVTQDSIFLVEGVPLDDFAECREDPARASEHQVDVDGQPEGQDSDPQGETTGDGAVEQ